MRPGGIESEFEGRARERGMYRVCLMIILKIIIISIYTYINHVYLNVCLILCMCNSRKQSQLRPRYHGRSTSLLCSILHSEREVIVSVKRLGRKEKDRREKERKGDSREKSRHRDRQLDMTDRQANKTIK